MRDWAWQFSPRHWIGSKQLEERERVRERNRDLERERERKERKLLHFLRGRRQCRHLQIKRKFLGLPRSVYAYVIFVGCHYLKNNPLDLTFYSISHSLSVSLSLSLYPSDFFYLTQKKKRYRQQTRLVDGREGFRFHCCWWLYGRLRHHQHPRRRHCRVSIVVALYLETRAVEKGSDDKTTLEPFSHSTITQTFSL